MSKYRIDISAPAESDLRDIARYISSKFSSPMAARNMMDAIEGALAGLADKPTIYPTVTDERLAAMGYRKMNVKNYIAFFTVDEKAHVVNVERILYARRDWLRIL